MPEVQRSNQSGELTQTFLEFILMQAQQCLFAMGRHPQRPPNAPPPNLALAKRYVDHLVMIRWKTQGNLTPDELSALNNSISHLQSEFVAATSDANDAGG
jgi:Domain of unknown function (DUF1844)